MAVDQMPRKCRHCKSTTMQYRKGLNHVFHIALCFGTCGLWAMVYGFLIGWRQSWKCGSCGRSSGK